MSESAVVETPQAQLSPVDQMLSSSADTHAMLYSQLIPPIRTYVSKLSVRQVRRLLLSLLEYPLQNRDYKHTSEIERQAFGMANQLLESKYTMMVLALLMNGETVQALEEKTLELEKDQENAEV